jgi:hypothetical protein
VKTRAILILASLAVVVAVVLVVRVLTSPPVLPRLPQFGKGGGLSTGKSIQVNTWAGDLGVHKGDVFPYYVEVWYDPAQVSRIDKTSFDKGVVLEPFEVRDVKEKEFTVGSRTRAYQREYELQFIGGQVGQLYEFPTVVIRYELKGSQGLSNTSAVAEPVFVAARLPSEVRDLEFGYGPLRPVAGQVSGASAKLPWVLWSLGGCLLVLGVADLAWRAVPQWTANSKQKGKAEGVALFSETFRSLSGSAALGTEPRLLLYQMDRLLRIVLARKEKVDWLDGPDPAQVSLGIRGSVFSLLGKCEKAYSPRPIEQTDAEDALRQLETVLAFYFGQAEVEAWRS